MSSQHIYLTLRFIKKCFVSYIKSYFSGNKLSKNKYALLWIEKNDK